MSKNEIALRLTLQAIDKQFIKQFNAVPASPSNAETNNGAIAVANKATAEAIAEFYSIILATLPDEKK